MNKKTAMGIIGGVICIIAMLVGYGFYLNISSEKNISQQIQLGKEKKLYGVKVVSSDIVFKKEFVNLKLKTLNMEDVSAVSTGRVEALYVKPNQIVTKGQPLMQLSGDDIKLQIAEADDSLARTMTEVERYRKTMARNEKLLAMNAIAASEFDNSKSDYLSAVAQARAAKNHKAQLELMLQRQLILAPIDGEVIRIYKHLGSVVAQGTPLVMVGNFSRLLFRSDETDENIKEMVRAQEDGLYLKVNREINIEESSDAHVYDSRYNYGNDGVDQRIPVKLEIIKPPLDKPAAYRNVIYSVDNSSGILEPRVYVNACLLASKPHHALLIPYKAVHTENGHSRVYVWNAKHELELREISINALDSNLIEVLGGLQEGEIIISSYKAWLQDGMAIDVEVLEGEVSNEH